MLHFEAARRIWKEFVPPSGQASTIQGELMRAVEKLRDEATRNGNANWDAGFEILLAYLRGHLLDTSIYPIEVIDRTRTALERITDFRRPVLDDALYDELGDRVVEYFQHFGSRPHVANPDLRR